MSKGNKKAAKPVSKFRNAENGTTYTKQATVPARIVLTAKEAAAAKR